ncbi:S8 family peptidase [Paenibacillus lentus]|uniref:S8 family peptidase n=1 Tax=Paenibacillus lentus TaxID=1338368 RepID=UPI003646A8C3
MKWGRWAAIGLSGAAAIAVLSLFPSSNPSPKQQIKQQTKQQIIVPRPAEEKQLKQHMLRRDVTATERLARLDAKQHLKTLAAGLKNSSPSHLTADIRELQKGHKQFRSIMLYSPSVKKDKQFRSSNERTSPEIQEQVNYYVGLARKALRKSESYESPSFPEKDPHFFVVAEPSKHNKDGIIAVMDTHILKRVKEHQDKNLRLIPYPKEGKYKIESVHSDTLKDLTVKTGHDNEKASHYYEHEIVVTFADTPSERQLAQIQSDIKAKKANKPKSIRNTYIFQSETMSMNELKTYFTEKWRPAFIEPHYLYLTNEIFPTPAADTPEIPNDMLFSEYQWNLPIIETNRGWKLSKGSNDVIVAVVDTGVDLYHPDLQGRLLKGYNVVAPDEEPVDDVGHGTHVAGIISANVNNGEGIAGMMWGGKILPVKALDKSGSGTTYSVAQGIIWAADNGAKVINLSLGNYADAQFLHEAIKYAYDKDVVLVAATGNDNTERPGYPAAYPEVLSVSATDYNLQKASFSNYGDYVDVVAPGESIASTYPDNQYAALSGTSMASPHVAALAALIRSVNPDLKNTEVMDIIRNNVIDLGDPGHDNLYGHGQIDVYAALEAAGGSPAPLQLWPQHIDQKLQRLLEDTRTR